MSFFEAFQRFAANLKEICIWSPFTRIERSPCSQAYHSDYSVSEPKSFYTADHFHSL